MNNEENKLKRMISNISYTFWANAISTIISVALSLLVPKLLSIADYGLWQLYSFYIAYMGIFHLGWTDGIYLKFGGYEYDKLPKKNISNQFWALNVFEIVLSVLVIGSVLISNTSLDNKTVLIGFAVCFVINSARLFILQLYQATNRIKEYSKYVKLDRYIFFVLVMCGLVFGVREYIYLIIVDLIGKFISLLASIKGCKDIVFVKFNFSKATINTAIDNIRIGSKLTFAGIMSSLIIGVLRKCIQIHWGIDAFAKISLTLNISNIMMLFINTVGQIIFPMLRTINKDNYCKIYQLMRSSLVLILLGMILCYFPTYPILKVWLPQYADALKYMALLFPVYVFESKGAILFNSFLKTIREEKWILYTNIISLFFCLISVPIAVFVFNNLVLAVLFYVFTMWLRNFILEMVTTKLLGVPISYDIIVETLLILIFMIFAWSFNAFTGMIFYIVVYLVYLWMKREDVNNIISIVKNSFKKAKV